MSSCGRARRVLSPKSGISNASTFLSELSCRRFTGQWNIHSGAELPSTPRYRIALSDLPKLHCKTIRGPATTPAAPPHQDTPMRSRNTCNCPLSTSTTAACSQSPHGVTAKNLLSALQTMVCRCLSSTWVGVSNLARTTLGRAAGTNTRYDWNLSSFFFRANCTPNARLFPSGENDMAQTNGGLSPSNGAPSICSVILVSDCCCNPVQSAAKALTQSRLRHMNPRSIGRIIALPMELWPRSRDPGD